jgi:hypothetical protein
MNVNERSCGRQVCVAAAAVLALFGAGCNKDQTLQQTPQTLTVADTQGLSPAQVAIFQEAVTEYDTDTAERPPLAIRDTAFPGSHTPGDSAPHMTIATMRLKTGHPKPPHRLIARIKSDGDYPGIGIREGTNFIWRSSWDTTTAATWITKVVPMKASAPEYVLHRDARLHEYTSGSSAAEPRLVKVAVASFAFATCLDDPMCGSGHCGYW